MVLKKLAVGLACIGLVLFGTVPVHAANDAEAPHVHIFNGTNDYFSAITGKYNEGTHTVVTMRMYRCSCGEEKAMESSRREEAHSLHFTSISDNHPSPGYHDFRGTCACGYTTTIMIFCPGGNGHVAAPN